MLRRLFRLAVALSLAICGATAVLWVLAARGQLTTYVAIWPMSDLSRDPERWPSRVWVGADWMGFRITSYKPLTTPIIGPAPRLYTLVERMDQSWYYQKMLNPAAGQFRQQLRQKQYTRRVGQFVYGHGYPYYDRDEPDGYTMVTGRVHFLDVPYWAVFVLSLALPSLWLVREFRRVCARSRLACGLCPVCRYDCRATPQRCPECGTILAGARSTPFKAAGV